ncbi:MAG: ion channel [Acidobacteria bacterium]|nr:ion channel [Acidobacteriota bacterium]
MQTTAFDPGFTQRYGAPLRRMINKDGSFNVHRRGTTWKDAHLYLYLIAMPWWRFLILISVAYIVVNLIFASAYYGLGPGELRGPALPTAAGRFANAFFFSAQTLTTVGYGTLAPTGIAANGLAAFEALVGLMAFALGTGLLVGRVSRPSARIGFSERMLMAPYGNGSSLQFRVVNKRPNTLLELRASLLLMTVEDSGEGAVRRYHILGLERENVSFLPLTWTIVHPIDRQSPLWGKTAANLEELQAEVLVLVQAYDDTFSQIVHARNSYRYDEIVWGARFTPAFHVASGGDLVLEVEQVGTFAPTA